MVTGNWCERNECRGCGAAKGTQPAREPGHALRGQRVGSARWAGPIAWRAPNVGERPADTGFARGAGPPGCARRRCCASLGGGGDTPLEDDSPEVLRAEAQSALAWAKQCPGPRREAETAAAQGRLDQLQSRLEECHPLRTRITWGEQRVAALRAKDKARAAAEAAEAAVQAAAIRLRVAEGEATAAEDTLRALRAEGLRQDAAPLPDLVCALAARADDAAIGAMLAAARAQLASQAAAATGGPASAPAGGEGGPPPRAGPSPPSPARGGEAVATQQGATQPDATQASEPVGPDPGATPVEADGAECMDTEEEASGVVVKRESIFAAAAKAKAARNG